MPVVAHAEQTAGHVESYYLRTAFSHHQHKFQNTERGKKNKHGFLFEKIIFEDSSGTVRDLESCTPGDQNQRGHRRIQGIPQRN